MAKYAPIKSQGEFEERIRLSDRDHDGIGTPESVHLDFKVKQDMTPDKQRELARDVAQFANTEGGTLVVGVHAPRNPKTGIDTAKALVPLRDGEPGALFKWIAQALSSYLYPAAQQPVPLLLDPWGDGPVLVINVEPSATMVAVWRQSEDDRGVEYIFRTEHGRQQFTPEQAAMRLEDWSARTTRLKIERILAEAAKTPQTRRRVVLVPPLSRVITPAGVFKVVPVREAWPEVAEPLYEDAVDIQIRRHGEKAVIVTIPYHYIAHAWKRPDGMLVLDLDVTILERGGEWEIVRGEVVS